MNKITGVKQITTKELGNGNYPNGYKYMITPCNYIFSDGQSVYLIKSKDKIQEVKNILPKGRYFLDENHSSYRLGLGNFTI